MSKRLVWLSALGGEARTAIALAIPRPVFVARPQRVRRDAAGRIQSVASASSDANPGHGMLVEWLYRIGGDDPDFALVILSGSQVPQLVAADWIHHASRVVALRRQDYASAERVA